MIQNKEEFCNSMKATMNIIGTLAMLVAVCVINFDRDLALAAALGGCFTLSVENLIPYYSKDSPEEEIKKSEDIEHRFQSYDLIKKGPKKTW